jgi:hypothetical protein
MFRDQKRKQGTKTPKAATLFNENIKWVAAFSGFSEVVFVKLVSQS